MNFFNDFFNNGPSGYVDDGHHGVRRPPRRGPTELERTQNQVRALAQENEELQARLNGTEHELQALQKKLRSKQNGFPQRSEVLEEKLRAAEHKLAQYFQRFGDLDKRGQGPLPGAPTGSGRAQRSGERPSFSDQKSGVSGTKNASEAPSFEEHSGLDQSGFYIQEEENVSVKDQQIRELKQAVRDLSAIYADFGKYKRFYEAHSSQSEPHRGDSQMPIEQQDPKSSPEAIFEGCKARRVPFFQGTLVDGVKEGWCREVDSEGSVFEGTYANGSRQEGKLDCPDFLFEGQFVDGLPSEQSGNMVRKSREEKLQLTPNCFFTGQTLGGVPNGVGVLKFQSGICLRGTFENGRMSPDFPVSVSGPELQTEVAAQLIQIQGLEAVVVKPASGQQTFIWNLKSGELKLI